MYFKNLLNIDFLSFQFGRTIFIILLRSIYTKKFFRQRCRYVIFVETIHLDYIVVITTYQLISIKSYSFSKVFAE